MSYNAWADSASIGGHADVVFVDVFGSIGSNALLIVDDLDINLQKEIIDDRQT